jgi:hypothetical protein
VEYIWTAGMGEAYVLAPREMETMVRRGRVGTIRREATMPRSPRFWLKALFTGSLLVMQAGVVAAQIPNPLDTPTAPLPSPIDAVDQAVQEVVDTIQDTTKEVTDPVKETAEKATEPVNTVKNNDAGGTVAQKTGGGAAGGAASSDPVETVGGAVSQAKEATTGGAEAGAPAEAGAAAAEPGYRTYTSSATGGGGLSGWARSRRLLSGGATLGTSQPSLAILVDAVNDADGDGVFSNAEIAPAPGGDVNFKALVTNIGSTDFEIAGMTHTFSRNGSRLQEKVCGELMGIMLAPGESLACSFPVGGYAPAPGESVVNTVMAAAFETGKSRRGTSDSDTSTVDTLLGDEVLAVAIERKPNLLAFTGTGAARLLALAMVLIGVGGSFLYMARVRRRAAQTLPSKTSAEMLGWWSTAANGHSKEKVVR